MASPNIIINLPSRTLELYSGATSIKEYPVAIGKSSTPTPLGNFHIIHKEINPVWIPPQKGYIVPSGPDNPLGYRWMGFGATYGIHGTNAPWAIGKAVSNGCIRMNEEDAEELYEVVQYGLPIRVTYDCIKIRVDTNGYVSSGVYPDVYGYGVGTLADMKSKLAQYGLSGWVSDDFLQTLINEEAGKQVVFARLVTLKVNGKAQPEPAIYQNNILYVPVGAVARALNINVTWDVQKQTVYCEQGCAFGVVKGDILYVSADNLSLLFSGQHVWKDEENCLEFDIMTFLINDIPLFSDVRMLDGVLAVPALTLAERFGQKVEWDASNGILVKDGKQIPVGRVGEKPFLKITQIYEYFNAYVYWNMPEKRIEITYPFKY